MRFGLTVPNLGEYADAGLLGDLAAEAEAAGWDGVFLWDHLAYRRQPVFAAVDPWVALTVMATRTERVLLGPMVTPLARRRPQGVARQATTLDHLSGGRLIFGAGLGTPPDVEFEAFGEDPDARVRAARLDEALDVLCGLWSGEAFSYEGEHQRVDAITFRPPRSSSRGHRSGSPGSSRTGGPTAGPPATRGSSTSPPATAARRAWPRSSTPSWPSGDRRPASRSSSRATAPATSARPTWPPRALRGGSST